MIVKAVFIDFSKKDVPPQYLARLQKLFNSTVFISRDDPRLLKVISDAEVIFAKIFTKIDKEFMNAASKLKYIGVLSTAYDAIDAQYARSKGVTVCNLGGYSTEAVAEFFFAALFDITRQLEKAKQQARNLDFSFDKFMGIELQNRVLGVVGAGKIGSRIAEIGLRIGLKVIYFSRKSKPELDKLGAKKMMLEDVLSKSDFISLNLALNKETEGIIDKRGINILKKGCVLINLAPPPLIDQEAMLSRAKRSEVTFIFDHSDDIDPKLAKRFVATKNCIVYPPVAFRTEEANTTKWETFVSNIETFAKGKPQNVVN